jgi:hypothetical protein
MTNRPVGADQPGPPTSPSGDGYRPHVESRPAA